MGNTPRYLTILSTLLPAQGIEIEFKDIPYFQLHKMQDVRCQANNPGFRHFGKEKHVEENCVAVIKKRLKLKSYLFLFSASGAFANLIILSATPDTSF